ncbi:MAG: DEAD/DEAH box helicase [Bullifex sp.]|nr:DEAD/DEAH box helicase [Bullifex sp.]
MKYVPHDYQEYATEFILGHPEAAVLLDMGLGKSVITLTALHDLILDSFLIRKALVIAPLRVARDTWPSEMKKWDHLSDLTCSVAVGTERERRKALTARADIFIINRENVAWLVEESGIPFDWDCIVIDELSSFRSGGSKRFRSLMKVRPLAKRVIGLTGTPSSNGLMDLWAEYRLIDMGVRLGRFITRFRDEYFVPDARNGAVVYSYRPKPGAEDAIYGRIGDITMSMKASDHLKLPECVMNEVYAEMDERERAAYETMKKDMVAEIGETEIDAASAAALSGKLLQMANGAVYRGDGAAVRVHDRKLDCLEDLIKGANGKPVLVAYWFRHDAERIRARFRVREIKTGKDIDDWNSGRIPVALIHPASAGHGLNLQEGGSTLVWFGLTWSLELYLQTNARLHRQGQRETVVIHHIICRDTIDERVMKALAGKEAVQDALMEAVKAEIGKVREKEE